jgi:hypothetical protein
MNVLPLVLILWILHIFVAGVVVAPLIALAPSRASWKQWEMSVFVVPFLVWAILLYSNLRIKAFANLLECFIISGAIALAGVIRLISGPRTSPMLSASLLTGVTSVAVLCYLLVPCLGE